MSTGTKNIDNNQIYCLEDSEQFSKSLKALENSIRNHLSKHSAGERNTEDQFSQSTLNPVRLENSLASPVSIPSRADKVIVFVKIVILKLGDIDTMRDKFSADVFIQCKWREPALDGKFKSKETINWDLYWNPRLSLENVIGEPKEQLWHTVTFDNLGQAIICEKRRATGAFLEFMELYQFPFDTQDLSVSVISDRDQTELELTEDPKEKCLLNVSSFADVQEWKLHDGCTTWKDIKEESFNNSNKKHPSFGASCKVSRRPQFFIWNIFVIMTIICSLCFATFSVSYTIPHSRLQLTFILLLTTVSFKFVANQNLPTISYLTYLQIRPSIPLTQNSQNSTPTKPCPQQDRYILGLMGILALICVWHAVVFFTYNATRCDQDLMNTLDLVACVVFASIYVLFHVIFACIVACVKKDSAGHGTSAPTSDDMYFDDDYTDDYSLPNKQEATTETDHRTTNDDRRAADNNQTAMVACGFE